jgi:hypothetical protein
MDTTPTIRIEVALPPAVVLEQLARYGKDWHESKLPPEARRIYYQCSIRVQGGSFVLRLGPQGTDLGLSWRGSVDSADGGGSIVTAMAALDRMPVIPMLLVFAIWVGYQLMRGERVADLVPGLGVVLVFFLPLVLIYAPHQRSKLVERQAPLCRAVLLRATQKTAASSMDSGAP